MKNYTFHFIIALIVCGLTLSPIVSAEEGVIMEESFIYQPEYISAKILKEKLSFPDLRVVVIDEKGYLLLQGKKNKIQKAKKILKRMDSSGTPSLIKYTLTIIDLSREKNTKVEIPAAGYSSDEGDNVSFLSENLLLELYSPEVMDHLEIKAAAKSGLTQRIARPKVVTALGESGSISFSEEYFGLEEELHDPDASSLSVNFNPQQFNEEQGIKSRVELTVNEVRELNTTTWTEPGEQTLLGLMTLKQQQDKSSIFGQEDNIKKRSFAVYMTAKIQNSNDLAESKQESFSASLDGAEKMLFDFDNNSSAQRNNYFKFLGGENDSQLDLYVENKDNAFSVELHSREKELVDLGINFPIRRGFKLGGHLIHQQNKDLSLGFALSDYVHLSNDFWLAASYFPLIYNFDSEDVISNHGWVEAEYNPGFMFLKIRYISDYSPHDLRLETGFRIYKKIYFTAAGVGDISGIENYLVGIKLNF